MLTDPGDLRAEVRSLDCFVHDRDWLWEEGLLALHVAMELGRDGGRLLVAIPSLEFLFAIAPILKQRGFREIRT